MKKDIKNIQASIRAKLQNKAKATNRPFQRFYNIMEWSGFFIDLAVPNMRINLF
jgi:hypothetical protein